MLELQPPHASERPIGRAIKRGLLSKCPKCGEGGLFRRFIKPVEACATCGEDMSPQRADDLPAYIVVVIVGHVMVSGFLAAEMIWSLPSWAHLAIWAPVTLLSSLALLQPVKGGVIGLQWALRMHGFGGHDDGPADHLPMNSGK